MQVQDALSLLSGESVNTIRRGLEAGVRSGNGLFLVATGFCIEHAYFESWLIAVAAAVCAYLGWNSASSTQLAKKTLAPILSIEVDPGSEEALKLNDRASA